VGRSVEKSGVEGSKTESMEIGFVLSVDSSSFSSLGHVIESDNAIDDRHGGDWQLLWLFLRMKQVDI
jgi:hypothetical protein